MTTMIERVARVLCRISEGPHFVDHNWRDYTDDARAVVAEMREPTDDMNAAGMGFVQSEFAWEAMIDAALNEAI